MWVRWSLPRFRFDQLMMLAWRALIPISLALLMMTAIVVFVFHGESYNGGGRHGPHAALLAATSPGDGLMIVSTLDSRRAGDQSPRESHRQPLRQDAARRG
jgi:hypothetical protein